MGESVSVSRDINAAADDLWAMVSDITRMSEWSPENEGGEWLAPATAAQPGAKFRGRNRRGKRSWKTVGTVLEADPGRVFSFQAGVGPAKIADWSYSFEALPTGCRVTETWTDHRAGWMKHLGHLVSGVGDRATHNRAGMEQTLERLAEVAEGQRNSSA
jgi:uncharacterized protein YndB with AHSA1/START domain